MLQTDRPAFTPPQPCGIITLTTDFGTCDCYAGAIKGVLLSINPECRPVDLTHDIPPQDIQAGALCLARACPFFPAGSVHLAVIDPGVGSVRRPLILVTERQYFIGPDNGLFSAVMQSAERFMCIEPTDASYFLQPVSTTFHGRDIFAPVCAHITRGIPLSGMGRLIDDPVRIETPAAAIDEQGRLSGTIIHIDRFGNLITDIPQALLAAAVQCGKTRIECAGKVIRRIYSSYAEAGGKEMFGIIGSGGTLEISRKNSSAQKALNARRGQRVSVSPAAPHR